MKICIAYDGSPHAKRAIRDLANAGLPEYVESTVLSVADVLFVRENIDLVVAGSRGRGAIMRLVLGSVSQRLVHYATCAVRVVHENITSRLEPPRLLVGYDGPWPAGAFPDRQRLLGGGGRGALLGRGHSHAERIAL